LALPMLIPVVTSLSRKWNPQTRRRFTWQINKIKFRSLDLVTFLKFGF
jgi:hypothetical protein